MVKKDTLTKEIDVRSRPKQGLGVKVQMWTDDDKDTKGNLVLLLILKQTRVS